MDLEGGENHEGAREHQTLEACVRTLCCDSGAMSSL